MILGPEHGKMSLIQSLMMLKYTHKSGGKVSKKIELKEHVVVHFPSRPELTINCDGIGD